LDAGFFFGLLFHEVGGSKVLQNAGVLIPDYIAKNLRKLALLR
jgi:hypothetical protein